MAKKDNKTAIATLTVIGLGVLGLVGWSTGFINQIVGSTGGKMSTKGSEGSGAGSGTGAFTGASASMGNVSLEESFKRMLKLYPKEFCQQMEQMYRQETADFKSGQWLACLSPGQVSFGSSFPYGWVALEKYRKQNNLQASDFGVKHYKTTSDGKPHGYVIFPNVYHNLNFTFWFLYTTRGGNVSAWFSLDKQKQAHYKSLCSKRKIVFTA